LSHFLQVGKGHERLVVGGESYLTIDSLLEVIEKWKGK
jgi:hypothetical protein